MPLLRQYLPGTRFTVRTDHSALKWILSMGEDVGKLARWRLRLLKYDFKVTYRPGIINQAPDSLRLLESDASDLTFNDYEIPTLTLETTASATRENDPEEDEVDNGDNLLPAGAPLCLRYRQPSFSSLNSRIRIVYRQCQRDTLNSLPL